jgi:ketosteroid isomerase-like protein
MEEGPRQMVERFYALLSGADDEGIVERLHPEVEWHWPRTMVDSRVFRGREEFVRGTREFAEAWGDLRFELDELHEEGGWAFAVVRYVGSGRSSGIPLDEPIAHLWEIRDGLVTRLFMFGDVEKARQRFLAGDRPA